MKAGIITATKKGKKNTQKKTSSQQSWRCRNNEVKEALIDSSVSTHGDISIAYRNELTDSLWAIFFEGASKQDIFESECSPNPNPKNTLLCTSQIFTRRTLSSFSPHSFG